ncbi:MAG: hypothetical protein KUG78_21175 [Kangiellaceae bacterium]|nr:hypothetical protein [Kangiellaceae bacterium]
MPLYKGMSGNIMLNKQPAATKQGFTVDFDAKHGIMVTQFYGEIYLKDIIDSLSTVIRHREFVVNMSACYDFTHATIDIDISTTEIVFHFLTGLADKRGTQYQMALVYADEMTKAIFDFYRLTLSRTDVDVELFKNRATAIDWIVESAKEASVIYI